MTHFEEAEYQLKTAQGFDRNEERWRERIEYAKVEATLAITEELRLARERKTFVLPSGTMVNLDTFTMAWWFNDILFIVCDANGLREKYHDADADALAEALGMTKKETE